MPCSVLALLDCARGVRRCTVACIRGVVVAVCVALAPCGGGAERPVERTGCVYTFDGRGVAGIVSFSCSPAV
eukprot:1540263-Prymnesium_polylepis.3